MADESEALSQNGNEYDQVDMWMKERKNKEAITELLELKPVSLVTDKGGLRLSGNIERNDAADWV